MFDYMNRNIIFFSWKYPLLWFMFMLKLQMVKLDYSCFILCHFYDKHNMNLAVLVFSQNMFANMKDNI